MVLQYPICKLATMQHISIFIIEKHVPSNSLEPFGGYSCILCYNRSVLAILHPGGHESVKRLYWCFVGRICIILYRHFDYVFHYFIKYIVKWMFLAIFTLMSRSFTSLLPRKKLPKPIISDTSIGSCAS